jgi:hypothetical protein
MQMKRKLKKLRRWMRKAMKHIAARSFSIAEELAACWRTHVDRMIGEPGYAQAFRDLIETGVRIVFSGHAARYVADQLLTAYIAVLRLLRPPQWEEDGLDWS